MAKYALSKKWLQPFVEKSMDVGALYTSQIIVKPRQIIDNNTNEFAFELPSMGNHLLNLNSVFINVKGKLKKENGDNLDDADQVALSNFGLISLFSKSIITCGMNQCKIVYDDLPYIYHRNLIDSEKKTSSNFHNIGYFPDWGVKLPTDASKFTQYEAKKALTEKSKSVSFMGKFNSGFFNMDSYMFKNVPIIIELYRSNPDFYLHTTSKTNYKFVIEDIFLTVDVITPNPTVSQALEDTLESQKGKISFPHIFLKRFHLPDNSESVVVNNAFEGVLPRRVSLMILSQGQYLGTKATDPHTLSIDKYKNITLKTNDREFCELDVKKHQLLTFQNFIRSSQCGYDSIVDFDLFKYSESVITFDFNFLCNDADLCVNEPRSNGRISLEIQFNDPLGSAHMLLIFCHSFASIEIDSNKNVAFLTK